MRTTKTVWPLACPEGSSDFASSQTLDDPAYLAFVLDLKKRGFEVTWHGATMESSLRDRTVAGLERFREHFGHYPRIHTNHAGNRENLYWGPRRIDHPFLKLLLRLLGHSPNDFAGDREDSPYWWGDLCERHIVYSRNLTFRTLNLASINPGMPYHDPTRPAVRYWFSTSDAEDARSFAKLIHHQRVKRLEEEGGFCIIATHFGKRFAQNGAVDPVIEERLRSLSLRPGWFPTVGELLDWLHMHHESDTLSSKEWRKMQWQWALDTLLQRSQ
jgi:hypothetical protein